MKKKDKKKFYSTEIKRNKTMNDDYKRAITFIVVLLIVCGAIGLLFLLNGKYVTKDMFQKTTTAPTTEVSYDHTLLTVSNLFDVSDSEYYVMLYDNSDETKAFLYSNLVVGFKEVDIPLYSVDMSNAMNSKYYDVKGTENTKPTKSSEVMITRPTLMHIKKGKVVNYITDLDTIVQYLTETRKED